MCLNWGATAICHDTIKSHKTEFIVESWDFVSYVLSCPSARCQVSSLLRDVFFSGVLRELVGHTNSNEEGRVFAKGQLIGKY